MSGAAAGFEGGARDAKLLGGGNLQLKVPFRLPAEPRAAVVMWHVIGVLGLASGEAPFALPFTR